MGWTETRLDYEDNPAGDPKIDRIDPLEMVWDSAPKSATWPTSAGCSISGATCRLMRRARCVPAIRENPFEDADYNATWVDDRFRKTASRTKTTASFTTRATIPAAMTTTTTA
jgi:hypothetical protein